MFYLTDAGVKRLRVLENKMDQDTFPSDKDATEFLVVNSIDRGYDDLNAIIHRLDIPEREIKQELRSLFEARLIEEG